MGLTEQDVEMQLNAALYGQVATTIPEQDRMTRSAFGIPTRSATTARLGQTADQLPRHGRCCGQRDRGVNGTPLPAVGFVPLEDLATISVKRSAERDVARKPATDDQGDRGAPVERRPWAEPTGFGGATR